MLSSIGRAAARRLAATGISTPCSRIAVSQVAVRQAFKQPVTVAYLRGFATARATAKKPAAKKVTKKAAVKKAATTTKKKPGPKKTTNVKKAAPKKKKRAVRKVLTPEQQVVAKAKAQIKLLKEKALFSEPKGLPALPYHIYFTESIKSEHAPGQNVTELVVRVGSAFKRLSSSELDVSCVRF